MMVVANSDFSIPRLVWYEVVPPNAAPKPVPFDCSTMTATKTIETSICIISVIILFCLE